MLGRPPWPSASFPSVKALAALCETTERVLMYAAHARVVLEENLRETFLDESRADEKLTPRDLSTDSIVLKCISHRSALGPLHEKYTVMCADISRSAGCTYLLTRIDESP